MSKTTKSKKNKEDGKEDDDGTDNGKKVPITIPPPGNAAADLDGEKPKWAKENGNTTATLGLN